MEFKTKTRVSFKQKVLKEPNLTYDENKVLEAIRKQDTNTLKELIQWYYRPFNHRMESLVWECIQGDFHKSLNVLLEEHNKGNLFETCFDPYVFVHKKIRYIFRKDKYKIFRTLVSQEYYDPNASEFKIICRHKATNIYKYLFHVYFKENFTVDELCEQLLDICRTSYGGDTIIVDTLLRKLFNVEEDIFMNGKSVFCNRIILVIKQNISNGNFDMIKKVVNFYIKLFNINRKRTGKKGKIRKIDLPGLISCCISYNRFDILEYLISVVSASTLQSNKEDIFKSLAMLSNINYVKYMLSKTNIFMNKNMIQLLKEAIVYTNPILTKFILDGAGGATNKKTIGKLFKFDTKHLKFFQKVCEEPNLKYNPANTIFTHFCITEHDRITCGEFSTNFSETINLLLDYDIDLSDYFFLILPYLSKRKANIDIIKRLLEGNNLKISRDTMYKCFYFAIRSNHYELFEYFLCLGYDPKCKIYEYYLDDKKKYKCLYFFNEYNDIKHLKKFADVNEYCLHDYYSENLLTLSVEYACYDIIEILLDQGGINPADNEYMVMTKYSTAPESEYLLNLLLDNDIIYNGVCEWVETGIRYVLYGITYENSDRNRDTYKELLFDTLITYIETFTSIKNNEKVNTDNDCICSSENCNHYEPSSNYYIQCKKCSNSMHLICAFKWLFERLDRLEYLFHSNQLNYIPGGVFDRSLNFSCSYCREDINLISETESYQIYCAASLES